MEISALIGMAIAGGGALTPQAMAELQHRLRSRPLTPNQVSYLEALIICQRRDECRTPPAQIDSIFATLLAHPGLGSAVKSDVLTLLAIYYAEQLGDLQAAERLMREAVSLLPDDPARYINLAQVLLFVPDAAGATSALKTAEEKDALGAHRSQITKLTRKAAVVSASVQEAKWDAALVD